MNISPSAVKHPAANCQACPLKNASYVPTDFGDQHGTNKPRVAIVSRSPGFHDVAANIPMGGPTGKIVEHLLSQNGYERADCMITNVVSCQTDKPTAEAIKCCQPRLTQELERYAPDVIIAAGSEPVQSLIGTSLSQARGLRHYNEDFTKVTEQKYGPPVGRSATMVATFNPAIVLREDTVFPDLVADFRRALNDPKPYTEPTVDYTEDPRRASQWLAGLAKEPVIACDIESTGLHATSGLVSIGFSASSERAYVLGHEFCSSEQGIETLKEFFYQYEGKILWHNGKFDCKILRSHGIPAAIHEDTLLLSYSLDERSGVHGLDYLLQNELDWPYYETEEVKAAKTHGFREAPIISFSYLKGRKVIKGKCLYRGISSWPGVYRYNGLDAAGGFALYKTLEPRVTQEGTDGSYQRLLVRASNALCEVERRGIRIDRERAQQLLDRDVYPRLGELEFRGQALCGKTLNFNSPKQLSEILYDDFGLECPSFRPGKERSVDSFNRDEWLQPGTVLDGTVRDFLEVFDEYKKLDKLRGTYLEGMVSRVSSLTSRLHCELLLHGTETGRLSSRKPNLQNIPRVDDNAKYPVPNIKSIFVPESGNIILQADYSQAELRVAAILSGDSGLQGVYRAGRDLHSEVARGHYGDDYSKEQRVYAKAVNFGILYGIGAWKLYQELHRRGASITEVEAKALILSWWQQFPQVRKWVKSVHLQARKQGYLMSPFGRRRRFHLITDNNLDHMQKEAVNFLIQSTASDLTLLALCELVERGAPVWLAVHDSILLEVPENEVDYYAEMVTDTMSSIAQRYLDWSQIPITADAQVGPDWGNLDDYAKAA